MVVRSVLVCLLAVSLSLTRSFAFPQSLLTSTQDKYSLTRLVVNSATGEPIRCALVQIYIHGHSSLLTGPDGKCRFYTLRAGQTPVHTRKPGLFPQPQRKTEPR